MRSDRIVQRRSLKDQLAQLKKFVTEAQPFIQYSQQLQQAYQAGVVEGHKQRDMPAMDPPMDTEGKQS